MKLISSWLKINRTLGATVTTTLLFCALLALGKGRVTSGAGAGMSAKMTAATSIGAAGPKLNSGASLVPPFVGDHTETWEEFPQGPLASGTSILEGTAT